MTTETLADRRDRIIEEHIAAECAHDVARALRTFHSAHYRVYPLAIDAPGPDAVGGLLEAVFTAFPDFAFVPERTYHAADAVIVEGRITGTHRGDWTGIAGTGNAVDVPTCCLYHFDEDRLTSESVYFVQATLLAQIGASAAAPA
jgi:ketosteroid isomerase-like protein